MNCKSCGAKILADNINIDKGIAKCVSCNSVFYIEDELNKKVQKPNYEVPLPKSMSIERTLNELRIDKTWFSGMIVFLTIFCIIWDGFLLVWYGIAFTTGELFMALFASLHLVVGVVLTYYVICSYINKTKIRVNSQLLSVKHGPLWWPGSIELSSFDIEQIYCKVSSSFIKPKGSVIYDVAAIMKNGTRKTLVSRLSDSEQGLFIEQEIEKYLNIEDRLVTGEVKHQAREAVQNGDDSFVDNVSTVYKSKNKSSSTMLKLVPIFIVGIFLFIFGSSFINIMMNNDMDYSSLSVSPDNTSIVTTNLNGQINLWDINTGKKKLTIDLSNIYYQAYLSPRNNTILCVTDEYEAYIGIFDANDGEKIAFYDNIKDAHWFDYNDKEQLLVVNLDGSITIFNPINGNISKEYKDLKLDSIIGNTIRSENKYILAMSRNIDSNQVTLHKIDLDSGEVIFSVKTEYGNIEDAVFSSDGKYFITSGYNDQEQVDKLMIWDSQTGEKIDQLNNFNGGNNLEIDSNSQNLITGLSDTDEWTIWNIKNKKIINQFKLKEYPFIFEFSENGKYLVVGLPKGIIEIYNTTSGKLLKTIQPVEEKSDNNNSND